MSKEPPSSKLLYISTWDSYIVDKHCWIFKTEKSWFHGLKCSDKQPAAAVEKDSSWIFMLLSSLDILQTGERSWNLGLKIIKIMKHMTAASAQFVPSDHWDCTSVYNKQRCDNLGNHSYITFVWIFKNSSSTNSYKHCVFIVDPDM